VGNVASLNGVPVILNRPQHARHRGAASVKAGSFQIHTTPTSGKPGNGETAEIYAPSSWIGSESVCGTGIGAWRARRGEVPATEAGRCWE
jgi:hypothetical protein